MKKRELEQRLHLTEVTLDGALYEVDDLKAEVDRLKQVAAQAILQGAARVAERDLARAGVRNLQDRLEDRDDRVAELETAIRKAIASGIPHDAHRTLRRAYHEETL